MSNENNRELIFGYSSKATFLSKEFRPCRFRTSLCPNECGHAKTLYKFNIDSISVEENPNSSQAKYCTPVKEGSIHFVPQDKLFLGDSSALQQVADSLVPQDKVSLDWNHDYVSKEGSHFPDHPVVKLLKL